MIRILTRIIITIEAIIITAIADYQCLIARHIGTFLIGVILVEYATAGQIDMMKKLLLKTGIKVVQLSFDAKNR